MRPSAYNLAKRLAKQHAYAGETSQSPFSNSVLDEIYERIFAETKSKISGIISKVEQNLNQ